MSGDRECLTESQQNSLAIEISEIAWKYARPSTRRVAREDIIQHVVLDCLVLLRAGRWKTPHEFLVPHIRERLKRTRANMRRGEVHRAERQNVFASELRAIVQRGMTELLEVDAANLKERIVRCLDELPAVERRILDLVVVQRMTYVEVAAETGISRAMVSKRLHHLREKVREVISDTAPEKKKSNTDGSQTSPERRRGKC
jgi:RNA polymerase sigma factor (sigma-70 family)